ncbi:MAG TPA: hypothetical protein VF625_09140 [Longimicrobium sp.]|jgi:hypothetical protein
MTPSRRERLREIYARLASAPEAGSHDAGSHDEAYDQLANIIGQVEDELTATPYAPDHWETDGRIYPPFADNRKVVEGRPGVTRYRSRKHDTFIGANGSIEIAERGGGVEFAKAGLDGRGVWELDEPIPDGSK